MLHLPRVFQHGLVIVNRLHRLAEKLIFFQLFRVELLGLLCFDHALRVLWLRWLKGLAQWDWLEGGEVELFLSRLNLVIVGSVRIGRAK